MKTAIVCRRFCLVSAIGFGFFTLTGCALFKSKPATAASNSPGASPTTAAARITYVSPEYHFVVIDFSSQPMPAQGTQLQVYRAGKRVGAVQLTEPARAQFSTADVLNGDLRISDEVR
jgi:hypothetical protein